MNLCMSDISWWMSAHLKVNLDWTKLPFLPGKSSPIQALSTNTVVSVVSLVQTGRNLGVILDDQLSFTANITATTCTYRLILHNIRRTRPFST